MDRAVVGLILTGLLAGGVAGSYALFWLLDQALNAINHIRRSR